MNDTEVKIQSIVDKMHAIFHGAIGARMRSEYMRENNIAGNIDWSFSLSADDIINKKIPPQVAGCTGRAKLFCMLAAASDLQCWVVATANYEDWKHARVGHSNIVNGHQIIAVNVGGKLRAFDPTAGKRFSWIDGQLCPGNFINAVQGREPYLITAIVPGAEFENCNTYQKLRNLYTSGNMYNSDFTIKPNLFSKGCKKLKSYMANIVPVCIRLNDAHHI